MGRMDLTNKRSCKHMKHPIYHTKRFWKLILSQYSASKQLFLCHVSNDFRNLWHKEEFKSFITEHAETFVRVTSAKATVLYDDCALFNTHGKQREVRLAFLKYMVKNISLRTIKSL